ncbi:MAG TPA: peptide-methionine (S)-S-oxide reductase MsrA [Anaerolineales bacterium]|nr:peptide-methionine (S)-S-oxide reductase MsrA [Anaerolineales bacterium]
MPNPDNSSPEVGRRGEVATLGGGCFWCLEPVFEEVIGVEKVEVGYAGGGVLHPSYEEVSTGRTGHAEVVEITFDPQRVSFRELLEVFFTIHDPTTPNRQGADRGPQYRSIILYHSEEQRQTAEGLIGELQAEGVWGATIVTELAPYAGFYRAEEVHQAYYRKNPGAGYCRAVIAPKLAKFRAKYASRLRGAAQRA